MNDNVHHLEVFPTSIFRWNSVLSMNEYDEIFNMKYEDKQAIKFQPLEEKIKLYVREVQGIHFINDEYDVEITEMWGNISPKGVDHPYHNHPNNLYSGIFYLTRGEPTTFVDPRPQHNTLIPRHTPNRFLDTIVQLEPIPNTLIIFPSYLGHFVRTNNTDNVRKTISFNIMLRGNYGDDNSLSQVKI